MMGWIVEVFVSLPSVSPIEASLGRVTLNSERLDIRTIVRSAVETITPALEKRQQRVVLSMPDREVWVDGDGTRLQQVLSNLLGNASKYGAVAGHVWMAIGVEGADVVIRVRDVASASTRPRGRTFSSCSLRCRNRIAAGSVWDARSCGAWSWRTAARST